VAPVSSWSGREDLVHLCRSSVDADEAQRMPRSPALQLGPAVVCWRMSEAAVSLGQADRVAAVLCAVRCHLDPQP
jgi:hypothetical protein